MTVGLALRFDLRASGLDADELSRFYAAALDMGEWADHLGFGRVTLSEHHGSVDNYLRSPMVIAAAIAARTSRLRIDIRAVPAPFHDPLRLAEDLAVVDVVSGGRIGVAIAGGYVESEFAMFGRRPPDRPRTDAAAG